jgi:hypothetical protein
MAELLTVESAVDYVARMMREGFSFAAVEITQARMMRERGADFVRVEGVASNVDGAEFSAQGVSASDGAESFSWDVWLENGRIYGEW